MKNVEIIDEYNSIVLDGDVGIIEFQVFPDSKKFTRQFSAKEDYYSGTRTYEYKISTNPIEIYVRLLESFFEPPLRYEVKDGVVLESDILERVLNLGTEKKENSYFLKEAKKNIAELKNEIEWNKVEMMGEYQINFYIPSKHPEIISRDDYRKFLRQSAEKLKLGVSNAQELVKNDSRGLKIYEEKYGKSIWYKESEIDKKEGNEYLELSEEEQKKSKYQKKIDYITKFKESLFTENSARYVGISQYEFEISGEVLEYIGKLLENKNTSEPDRNTIVRNEAANTGSGNKNTRWWVVGVISIVALSRGVWTAIGVFILGAIIINMFSDKNS